MFPSLAYLIIRAIAGLLTAALGEICHCRFPTGDHLGQPPFDRARRANSLGNACVRWGIRIGDLFADFPKVQLILHESPGLDLFPVWGIRRKATRRCFLAGNNLWAGSLPGFNEFSIDGVQGTNVAMGDGCGRLL